MPERLIPRDVYVATFPMVCEKCSQRTGMPFSAATVKEDEHVIRVGMRCRDCGHEWSYEIQSPDRRLA